MRTSDTSPIQDDWDQHWTHFAASAQYNPAQTYRRKLIFDLLDRVDEERSTILDIGSGQGDLALDLNRAYPRARIVGLELSRAGVEIASRKVPTALFLQRDLLDPTSVDVETISATHAVCSEVLEHLDEPLKLLVNARRYLAPGARLVVTVPGGPMSSFDRHIGHRRHFTCTRLHALLESAGYEVEHCYGAGFPFFNIYRLTIIARGDRLIRDINQAPGERPPLPVRIAMRLFDLLFGLNRHQGKLGWQIAATARVPNVPGEYR